MSKRAAPVLNLLAVLLSGSFGADVCAAQTMQSPPVDWRSELARTHPLAGKIFKVGAGTLPSVPATTITAAALIADLAEADVVQLGESHDNADHHLWQAWAIDEVVRLKSEHGLAKPGIVFEQLRSDQQPGLESFAAFDASAARLGTLGDFKRFIDWDKSGWPKDIYDPIFKTVLAAKLTVVPGDVTRDMIRKVAKEGAEAVDASERTRLGLDAPLGSALDDASVSEIESAHCGVMPKSAFGGMAYAQRFRDAHLADAVLEAVGKQGSAILIAGTSHVRTDRGVAWYIRQRAASTKTLSVMFVEAEDALTAVESYVPRDSGERSAADYIAITPRANRPDPCLAFRTKTPG